MERPVIGVDLGHGETAVYMRIGSRIFPLRLDAAGSLKMITALAVIETESGQQTVLIGNALRGYETLRRLQDADAQAVSGANFRALLLEYTAVLLHAAPDQTEVALYIPCEEDELSDSVRTALRRAIDSCSPEGIRFTLHKGAYFSPLYQTFKAPPRTDEHAFCAVTWDDTSNDDGVYKRSMRDLMFLFLKTLSDRIIAYNPAEWLEAQGGADIHMGVPALHEWLDPKAMRQYGELIAEALRPWLQQSDASAPQDSAAPDGHVSIFSEPCAALMAYFHEYPEHRLHSGISVSDHGSGSLDFCCIAICNGPDHALLIRITGSTDRCGGRMIEDGMLRKLTDREGLSFLRDISRSESSALRLQLRLLKEAYYTDPAMIGSLPQILRIHLNDGSIRTVHFTAGELIRSVVQPGSPWNKAVTAFAENMSAALTNQGVTSSSLFLTGGTANVTEAQEIFAAAGMGQCFPSADTSASVADGLCRMITRSELDTLRQEAAKALSAQKNDALETLITAMQTALTAELPALVTESTQKFLQKDRRSSLSHFSFDVENRLQHHKTLQAALHGAALAYAYTRSKQLVPIANELAQEHFPGRLPENPHPAPDFSNLVPYTGKIIARQFVHHLNFRGLIGGLLHGLKSLLGMAKKNPKLEKSDLERIGRLMRQSNVSFKIRNAVICALLDTKFCSKTDALVLEAIIGYLTLTRFDADVTL